MRRYDRTFKERAVKLSYERGCVKAFMIELGLSAERLYKWSESFRSMANRTFRDMMQSV